MADTVTYEIHIVQDGGESQKSAPKAVASVPESQSSEGNQFVGGKYGKIAVKMASFGIAIQAAKNVASTEIGRIELRTGHSTLQQRSQFVFNTTSKILSGNVVGMIRDAWNYSEKRQEIEIQRTVENIGIKQANLRASSGGGRNGKNTY